MDYKLFVGNLFLTPLIIGHFPQDGPHHPQRLHRLREVELRGAARWAAGPHRPALLGSGTHRAGWVHGDGLFIVLHAPLATQGPLHLGVS